jgi:hypothetical protein
MGMMGMRDGVGGREYGCIHKRYITILMNQWNKTYSELRTKSERTECQKARSSNMYTFAVASSFLVASKYLRRRLNTTNTSNTSLASSRLAYLSTHQHPRRRTTMSSSPHPISPNGEPDDSSDNAHPKIEALFLIRFDKKVGYVMRLAVRYLAGCADPQQLHNRLETHIHTRHHTRQRGRI